MSVESALRELAGPRALAILVVYEHLPRPAAAGADLRLVQVIKALCDAGHRVTLLGRNGGGDPRCLEALRARGVEVLGPDPERILWDAIDAPRIDFAALCRERRFDVALLYAYFWVGISVGEQYLGPIRAASPRTRVILLSDDCHWLREERRSEVASERDALERSRGLRVKEADSYARADLVLGITHEDLARFRADVPSADLAHLAFCQDPIPDAVPGFDLRTGCLFIGSGANHANEEAVRWFGAEVWPAVRERLPAAELVLVGEPPASGWSVSGPGVIAAGRVDDLTEPLARSRVFVSPVTYGTGLKTKNVQALAAGLPMVATPVSAEGMDLEAGGVAFVHADPIAFAEAIVRLHEDRDLWSERSARSLAHARTHFSRERMLADLAEALARVLAREPKAQTDDGLGPGLVVARDFPDAARAKRLAQRYGPHLTRARKLKAAGRLGESLQEIRNNFCELVCFQVDSRVYAELYAQLAGTYLAAGALEDAAISAAEAMQRAPALPAEARAPLERVVALAGERGIAGSVSA